MNSPRIPDFAIHEIPRQLGEDPVTGWRRWILYCGPTAFVDELLVHAGVLSARVSPHPPHCHDHEELHIALSDAIEHVYHDGWLSAEYAAPMGKGTLVFSDSNLPHTFRNTGSEPVAYLHVRWKRRVPFASDKAGLRFSHPENGLKGAYSGTSRNGEESVEIYSGPTRFLPKLTVRLFTLHPGSKVPLNRHDHEVLFAVVSGSVEIIGKNLDAPAVAFMGTRTPHYIINKGPEPAKLYAIEFHHTP